MPGMFKLVDVGPHLGLPVLVVSGRFPAGGTTGMERDRNGVDANGSGPRQFHEDTSYFLHFFVLAQNVLVAQQVSETQLLSLNFGLGAGVKRTILRPQLFG